MGVGQGLPRNPEKLSRKWIYRSAACSSLKRRALRRLLGAGSPLFIPVASTSS
jgi:hypothetical protein